MKQQIHTIPVVESFEAGDECPFCHLERQTERRAIRYFAGPSASYMEPQIRGLTNRSGFCGGHIKKLYDYGNPLGSALMIQTHCEDILEDLQQHLQDIPSSARKPRFGRKKEDAAAPYWQHLQNRVDSCVICDRVEESMQRQYRVFFDLLKEPEFREMIQSSKGFCLRHFARLLQEAEQFLPGSQQEWFYTTVNHLMVDHLQRVKEDLDWMIAKYDYRNADKPWGNSKDALQRAMQKLEGVYPADQPYRKE